MYPEISLPYSQGDFAAYSYHEPEKLSLSQKKKNWNTKMTHQNYEHFPRKLRETYCTAQLGVQCGR